MTVPGSAEAPPAAKASSYALFRERAFALFFTMRFAWNMSYNMLGVVVGWQVYEMTGSAFHLGLIGLVQFLPPLLLLLFAGQVADRFDRRRVLRISFTVEAVVPIGFIAVSLADSPPLVAFYLLLFVGAVGRTFSGPALQAILPSLVGHEVFGRAVAFSTSALKLSQLLGPSLGGLIIMANGTAGYAACFVLLALAATASYLLPTPRFGGSAKREANWGTVFAGFKLIRDNPVMLGLMSLDLMGVFFGGVAALLPIFAKDVLEIGPWGFGLLRSAPAVGALLMAVVLARWPVTTGAGRKFFLGVAVYGLSTVVFALSENVALSFACMLTLGAGDMLSQVLRQTIIQLRTPDDMRGRLAAVNGLSVNVGGQLGQFESGLVAVWLGAVGSALFGGIAVLAIVAIWMWKFPDIRRIEKPE